MTFLLFIEGTQGLKTLEGLLKRGAQIARVVLPQGFSCAPIQAVCDAHGIVYQWRSRREPVRLPPRSVDILVSSQFQYRILQEESDAARLGAINIHASILPTYRGKHSDVWALINGEEELGISVHTLVHDFDAGEILRIQRTKVNDEMTNARIYEQVSLCLDPILDLVESGTILTQTEAVLGPSCYWRVRTLADSQINWQLSAKKIFHFVRALSRPPIFAFTGYQGIRYEIVSVRMLSVRARSLPGTTLPVGSSVGVVCGDGHVVCVEELSDGQALPVGVILH